MLPDSDSYDVVIIGGAYSGGSTAILLKRAMPSLRVLIVEKQIAFDAKVGEATTEMSAMFMTRRLAIWQHLELEQLPKEGLRYWSANEHVTGHANASEAGGFLRSTVPSFQLRRDALDEHILSVAVSEGTELMRPATVRSADMKDVDNTVVIASHNGETEQIRTVHCKWLLDASGRNCFVGKRLDLIDWNDEHPVAAIWGRWSGVKHIDDLAARSGPGWGAGNIGSRRLGTNHYVGRGFWIWVIPLGSGETSIGVVYDKRFYSLHENPDRATTFTDFLKTHPALAELIEGATLRLDDLHARSRVAYVSRQYAGKGWALIGDAAAFLDPYYSPGLDHCSFSAEATSRIVLAHARGAAPADIDMQLASHNELFVRSYHRFFQCVYRDKYFFFGEHDLISASFLLDTALYYIFVVTPAYRFIKEFTPIPVLGPKVALPSYLLMKFMKARFKRITALRERAGEAGTRNNGRRVKAFYNVNFAPFHMFGRGIKLWAYAEADALRLRVKLLLRRPVSSVMPPAPMPRSSGQPA